MSRRNLLRSGRCETGESASSWIIVGTKSTSVTRCSTTAPKTEETVNFGSITCTERAIIPPTQVARSARWNIGAACNTTPPAEMNPPVACAPNAAVSSPRWLNITPLARPVVPPV